MGYVYWIYDDTCIDPKTDGYIGITNTSLETRMNNHRRRKRFPIHVQMKPIFEGPIEECWNIEKEYRPERDMGWNVAPGGHTGYRCRIPRAPMSEKGKQNISKGGMGHPAYPNQQKITSERSQKTYLVTDPQGKQIIVTNLRQFCIKNDLHQANMLYKKCGSKGWKACLVK